MKKRKIIKKQLRFFLISLYKSKIPSIDFLLILSTLLNALSSLYANFCNEKKEIKMKHFT